MSHDLADYSWEIAALEGSIGYLAVRQAFTVVRVSGGSTQKLAPPTGPLICHVVGASHESGGGWEPLETAKEAERVKQEIEKANSHNQFLVEIDKQGDWEVLLEKYAKNGLPHLFHFAGHGIEPGRGLVFCSVVVMASRDP